MGTQCTTLRHPFQYNQRDREKKRKEVRLMGSPQSLEELDSVAQGLGVPRGVSQERGCRGSNSGAHDLERKLCGHLSQFLQDRFPIGRRKALGRDPRTRPAGRPSRTTSAGVQEAYGTLSLYGLEWLTERGQKEALSIWARRLRCPPSPNGRRRRVGARDL
jgi:hypothetical protein